MEDDNKVLWIIWFFLAILFVIAIILKILVALHYFRII